MNINSLSPLSSCLSPLAFHHSPFITRLSPLATTPSFLSSRLSPLAFQIKSGCKGTINIWNEQIFGQ